MTTLLLFVAGLAALVVGSELLVRGASKLALSLGISPLVVGLTMVAFGTSSPEMAVSVQGALAGATDIAIGNVVGSNIFNVLFILGLCAVIVPLAVADQIIRQEVSIMIGASLLLVAMTLDGGIGRGEAAVLCGLLVAYTVFLVVQSRRASAGAAQPAAPAVPAARSWDDPKWVQFGLVAAGLVLLVLGSEWLVSAAVQFARVLGLSEIVIGLSIVAAGTSTPEVAASLMALRRGERDIAVGNVVGSNIFNILGVLGAAGLVAPEALGVPASVLRFDLPAMVMVAIACLPVFVSNCRIGRWEGLMFLAYYAAYVAWLVLDASGHDALGDYRTVMLYVVLPLTAVTIGVLTWRGGRATPRA
ncbi:MAG: calcium/sodium antiporter [Burkholderiales bacterium]|nr:calcium/sodium antiporter [Burkholderiales bacterium]